MVNSIINVFGERDEGIWLLGIALYFISYSLIIHEEISQTNSFILVT